MPDASCASTMPPPRGTLRHFVNINISQQYSAWPCGPVLHTTVLSLAIPSWVGAVSTSQKAVTPCVWGVKAGMDRVWVAYKNVRSPYNTRPYLSTLEIRELIYKALYKFSCLLKFF